MVSKFGIILNEHFNTADFLGGKVVCKLLVYLCLLVCGKLFNKLCNSSAVATEGFFDKCDFLCGGLCGGYVGEVAVALESNESCAELRSADAKFACQFGYARVLLGGSAEVGRNLLSSDVFISINLVKPAYVVAENENLKIAHIHERTLVGVGRHIEIHNLRRSFGLPSQTFNTGVLECAGFNIQNGRGNLDRLALVSIECTYLDGGNGFGDGGGAFCRAGVENSAVLAEKHTVNRLKVLVILGNDKLDER